ncbi:MAG: CPBP family intramembrane metalloprotease [Bacteroidota bacterium]|nr:CPBP family intramembrane metalloprotease [Bacteroidota bacterium]
MKVIIGYIRKYFYETDKRVLVFVTFLTGLLIFLNYHLGLDARISRQNSFTGSFFSRAGIFLTAFTLPYLTCRLFTGRPFFSTTSFVIFLLMAPLIFSFKVSLNPFLHFSDNPDLNTFWNHILYWPVLLVITATILFVVWKITGTDQPFYGIKTRGMNWKPYAFMLLIMLPLVAAASTQPDFQAMYPKLKLVTNDIRIDHLNWWHKLLFELSYGSDFITIELFFRGFLILAFIKWAGKDAILPMACFYCTIHFGKPLGECISSYFGGMILGIIVYNTRSILGGLMVHLGIAWMMEIGGYLQPLSP